MSKYGEHGKLLLKQIWGLRWGYSEVTWQYNEITPWHKDTDTMTGAMIQNDITPRDMDTGRWRKLIPWRLWPWTLWGYTVACCIPSWGPPQSTGTWPSARWANTGGTSPATTHKWPVVSVWQHLQISCTCVRSVPLQVFVCTSAAVVMLVFFCTNVGFCLYHCWFLSVSPPVFVCTTAGVWKNKRQNKLWLSVHVGDVWKMYSMLGEMSAKCTPR